MIWSFLHRFRWALLAMVVGIVVLSLPLAGRLKTDSSNQAVFEHDEAYEQNNYFQKTFGGDDAVVIGIGETSVLTDPMLRWINLFTNELDQNPSIQEVQSILNIPRIERQFIKVTSEPSAKKYFSKEESLGDFIDWLRANPPMSEHLLSHNRTFTIIVANLRPKLSSAERREAIETIENRAREHAPPSGKIYRSGTAVEQAHFVEKIQRDHNVFVPITFGLIMIAILFLHGHPNSLLYPAAVIVSTLITTQACMALAGVSLNMMTTLVSPVILIVSVGDIIHFQSHARHVGLRERPERCLRALYRSLATPCLLTTLTTVAGFLSLSFNRVPAVRQFGWFAALGTGLAFVWTCFLAPAFFAMHIKTNREAFHKRWSYVSLGLSHFALRHQKLILIVGSLVLIAGIAGITRTCVETDILGSFKAEDRFRRDTEKIHKELSGVYPLEIVLKSPSYEEYSNPDSLQKIMLMQEAIAKLPGVSHVKYLTDMVNVADKAVRVGRHIDGSVPPRQYLNRYLMEFDQSSGDQMQRIASKGYEWTRMSVFLTLSSTAAVAALSDKIREQSAELLPAGWSFFLAGQTYLLARMSQRLVASEVQSILAAMAAIWVLIVLWTKSIKAGLVSVFVNILPMALVFGSMPLLGIKLNTATAMIGAVAVGLIVDNTIHVLFRFSEAGRSFSGNKKAVEHVMNYCAQPMISSAFVLIVGFSVTLMGSVKPTVQFGMLMVMMTLAALASNLFILPAVLVEEKGRPGHGAL